MRFSSISDVLFSSPEKVRVLQLLLRFPKKVFSGREVAKTVGLSPPGSWRILKLFESYGIVARIRVGNTDAWRLEEKHFLTEKLSALESIERDALQLLKSIVLKSLKGLPVEKVVLFGSVARGDERPGSDVDILVVVKTPKDKERVRETLLDASVKISETFGNSLSPAVYCLKEYKAKANTPLLKNVKREGKVLFPDMTTETSTIRVERHKSQAYFSKAEEFFTTMKKSEEEELWNAASLNAIHCAISSADAITSWFLGERSKSQKHDDIATLIEKTKLQNCAEKAKQLRDVISLKNLVEYEEDNPTENEARRLCLQSERIFKWTKEQLKK